MQLERLEQLPRLRRVLYQVAPVAGLSPGRSDDFVLAANEVVTNALKHGRLPAQLRLHADDRSLTCEVIDQGPGFEHFADAAESRFHHAEGGRGLEMVRKLIGEPVTAERRPEGFVVTLKISR